MSSMYLSLEPEAIERPEPLPAHDGWPPSIHDFTEEELLALNTALASGRPLLVRGKPGTGKTQLARAAAVRLGRHFESVTLDAHKEARDLFWTLDAVRRLSEAQIYGATLLRSNPFSPGEDAEAAGRSSPGEGAEAAGRASAGEGPEAVDPEDALAEANFVDPGVLWWGFDWPRAADQLARARKGLGRRAPREGVSEDAGAVVLLDEIDKADPVLPNALLEALGTGRFPGPPGLEAIEARDPKPLVVITTNEERDLPPAFLRRCVVLRLTLPSNREDLIDLLVRRGEQHSRREELGVVPPSKAVLQTAAERLVDEREQHRRGVPPGQAEYLDLVKAVCRLESEDAKRLELIEALKRFVLRKDRGEDGDP